MPDARPYDTLLAKGEDRKQRILEVAQRLLTRNGWRNTTLAQIAGEAGVTPAGLLHHFESKEQLLHAVLDARDLDDDSHADRAGDLLAEIAQVADRFNRAPELVGTFTVLLVGEHPSDAPLHDRMLARQRDATDIVAEGHPPRSGRRPVSRRHRPRRQGSGNSRLHPRNGNDMVARSFDPADRGVQGVRGDAGARLLPVRDGVEPDMRYRLDVVASNVVDVVKFAGGWLFDRAMAGWDVTVLLTDHPDDRPLHILGAQTLDLEMRVGVGGNAAAPTSPGGRGRSARLRPAGAARGAAGP